MKNYTIIDLEWTSWKNNYFGKYKEFEKRKSWQKKEIIQIGAVKFNENFEVKKLLNIIVKPKINKKLSNHIISLTSLTDRIISKKGFNFLKAYKKLIKFSNNSYLLCNGCDGEVLRKNLKYNRSKIKLIKVLNIKKILSISKSKFGSLNLNLLSVLFSVLMKGKSSCIKFLISSCGMYSLIISFLFV